MAAPPVNSRGFRDQPEGIPMPKTAPNSFPRRYAAMDRTEVMDALIELRGTSLMDATVAACAIIAHADGAVSASERRHVISLMQSDRLLSLFARDEVRAAFDAHESAFAEDPALAMEQALHAIMPVAHRRQEARVVLQACLLITAADGRIDPRELDAIGLVREALGMPAGGGQSYE
jgi:tellurite resistance protein